MPPLCHPKAHGQQPKASEGGGLWTESCHTQGHWPHGPEIVSGLRPPFHPVPTLSPLLPACGFTCSPLASVSQRCRIRAPLWSVHVLLPPLLLPPPQRGLRGLNLVSWVLPREGPELPESGRPRARVPGASTSLVRKRG